MRIVKFGSDKARTVTGTRVAGMMRRFHMSPAVPARFGNGNGTYLLQLTPVTAKQSSHLTERV